MEGPQPLMGTKKKSGGPQEKSSNPSYVQEHDICTLTDVVGVDPANMTSARSASFVFLSFFSGNLEQPGRHSFFGNAAQQLSKILLDLTYANKLIYAETVSDVKTCAGDLYLKRAIVR
jgi:hypothetical protein